jgi:hypothetical protein
MQESRLNKAGGSRKERSHEIANCQLGRDGHKHMNVVAEQHTFGNLDAILRTYMTADITDPQAPLALQHLEPVFRGPDDVIPVIVNAMLARRVLQRACD